MANSSTEAGMVQQPPRRSVRARRSLRAATAATTDEDSAGSDSVACPLVFQAQPALSAQQTLLLVQQQLAHLAMLSQRQLEALERLQARWDAMEEAEAEDEEDDEDENENAADDEDEACDEDSGRCGRLAGALVAAAAWAGAMAWMVATLPPGAAAAAAAAAV